MIEFFFCTWEGGLILSTLYCVISFIIAVTLMRELTYSEYSVLISKNGKYKFEPDDDRTYNITPGMKASARIIFILFLTLWIVWAAILILKFLFFNPLFNIVIPKVVSMVPEIPIRISKKDSSGKKSNKS